MKVIPCLLSLVFVSSSTYGNPIGKCGRPAELNHGLFVMSSAGDAVSYVCDQGYDLLGDRDHKCENGEWVGEQPVCAAPGCPQLPVLKHGTIIYNHVMRMASFECDSGYNLTGVDTILCEADGWSHDMPTCEDPNPVIKPVPKHLRMLEKADYTCITKQKVVKPPDEQFTRKTVEWAVTSGKPRLYTVYRCAWGFVPVDGNQNLYCKEGKWIGGHPQCKYAGQFKRPIGLSAVTPTSHEDWLMRADYSCFDDTNTVQPPPAENAKAQVKVALLEGMPHLYSQYTCEEGFRLASVRQQYMYCEGKQWIGDLPQCLKTE